MHLANLENPKRCFVWLYKLYNSLCPPDHPSFLFTTTSKANQGYFTRAVGHNAFEKTVKRMCNEAGMVRYYTNHSIRTTAATRLYHHNIEKQQIMERTGHHGAETVRSYKRTSSHQQQEFQVF